MLCKLRISHNGQLAQLEEHFPYKEEAGGSSPSLPTKNKLS